MNSQPSILNQEQIDFYRDNGYLVVADLLSDDEVQAFLRHVDDNAERSDYGLFGHLHDEQYRHIATHPKIVGIAAQLLSGRPCVVQTMFLDKPAAIGKGISMHQDLHHLPIDPQTPETLMACWVALTDTDAGNGGLCVAPGTHRGELRAVHAGQDVKEHSALEIEHKMRDRDGREWTEKMFNFEIDDLDPETLVRLTVARGAGVFFTGRLIHGSFGNHSIDRPRRAFATHYVHEDTHLLRMDVQNTMPVDITS